MLPAGAFACLPLLQFPSLRRNRGKEIPIEYGAGHHRAAIAVVIRRSQGAALA
jgi:hypothetical protein